MADEMLSFNDVVSELGISEEELKKMIADNDIRTFRDGDELKFKRSDVSQLKNRLETAPTIVLSDTDSSSLLDEIGDDDSLLEEPTSDDSLLEEPSLDDGLLEDIGVEEPSLSVDDETLASEETVLNVDGILDDGEAITLDEPEEIGIGIDDIGDDTVLDSGLVEDEDLSLGFGDTEEDEILDEEEIQSGPRRISVQSQESSPVMTGLLLVTVIVMILPGAIIMNLAGGETGVYPGWITENLCFMNDMIDKILGWF